MGRIAGVVVVTVLLAAIAPGRFGGGGHAPAGGDALRWQAPARVTAMAGSTGDHLLFARVVNRSGRTLRLRASEVRVLDAGGHALDTTAAFADGFVPGVTMRGYDAEVYGSDAPAAAGRVVVVRAGQAVPLTVSFTARRGERAAAVDLGPDRLRLGS